ncbi:MAG: DUF4407 domain-containing protein [Puia sp.]|nr:DUF4407 domain-containing protein [Puia sp.]
MAATENGRGEQLYTYDSFNGRKKTGETHFLWWCAGTYQPLLKDCPTEHTKYAGLGGVILATFVLAALSAGYAIYSVFDAPLWAFAFALAWGLIIFNFDRFLVSTMRKYGVTARRQWMMAMPRVALALLIGLTIARPLELKVFEKEIDIKIIENRHHQILLNDSLLREESSLQVVKAEQERERLIARQHSLEDTLQHLRDAYIREADGTGGSGQRGIDKLTRLKKEAYDAALAQTAPERLLLDNRISYQDSLIKGARASLEEKRKQYEGSLKGGVGFLERNKALSDLTTQESSIFVANLLISLLIILVETGPVLSKLIMNTGPYDIGLAKMELVSMAGHEDEIRRNQELITGKWKEAYRQKREVSEEFRANWTALQKRQLQEELDEWEKGGKGAVHATTLNELAQKIKRQYDYNEKDLI